MCSGAEGERRAKTRRKRVRKRGFRVGAQQRLRRSLSVRGSLSQAASVQARRPPPDSQLFSLLLCGSAACPTLAIAARRTPHRGLQVRDAAPSPAGL